LKNRYYFRDRRGTLPQDRTPTHGYGATREVAMAAFAKSWWESFAAIASVIAAGPIVKGSLGRILIESRLVTAT
jgi:hypothetical protein